MKEWEPIVQNIVLEPFVDEKESQSIIGAVFTGIGLMVLASAIAMIFYWTYQKEKALFIAVFSSIMFVFSIKMLILVAVMRNKLNTIVFKIYMGSTIFVSILCLFVVIFFSIKAYQHMGSSTSSSSNYAPISFAPAAPQE